MKVLIFLHVILFASFSLRAQIPNAGFEDWLPNLACLRPAGWYTIYSEIDSSGSFCAIQRSDDHFPPDQGQYSIRIANDTSIWNTGTQPGSWPGWGIVFTTHLNERPLFPVQGKPKSFRGYYRFQPQNNDTLNLRAFLYHNGQEIAGAHFQSSETTSGWTFFRADFSDTNYAAVDSARLILSAANEPKEGSKGPQGNSILWVDNIAFDYLVSARPISRNRDSDWEIRIQRTNGILELSRPTSETAREAAVRISDAAGRLWFRGSWPSGNAMMRVNDSLLPSGILFLHYQQGNLPKVQRLSFIR